MTEQTTEKAAATSSTPAWRSLWTKIRHNSLAGAITVFVLGVVSLGAWGMSSPAGSEPDSDFHLASIWCTTAGPGSPCDLEERRNRKMVPTALIEARCFSQDQTASAGLSASDDHR